MALLSTLVENRTHEAEIFLRSKELFLKAKLQVLYLYAQILSKGDFRKCIVKQRALSPKIIAPVVTSDSS
jgi:hypothetical protein